jgi:hypothetical protein
VGHDFLFVAEGHLEIKTIGKSNQHFRFFLPENQPPLLSNKSATIF